MKKILPIAILLLTCFLFINGCKKNETTDDTPSSINTSSGNVKITLTGMVLSVNNFPLQGVTVTAHGQTTTTDNNGIFIFKDIYVNSKRCVVKASLSENFTVTRAFIPVAGTVNYTKMVMHSKIAYTFNSAAGATYTLPDNSSIQLAPNSFVTTTGAPFSGNMMVVATHLSPGDANFGFSIPGSDLAAKDSSGNDVILYSYGMLGVELVDVATGQQLQLAPGSTATLKFAIDPSQLSTAPATIPLWYFDESTSLWMQQGTANKVGSFYVGTVSHFTWWNCDYPFEKATIKGSVVDCNGNPMPNTVVTIGGGYTLITNQNGNYSSWVPANLALTAQVINTNNFGLLNSQIENIPALASAQVFTVPDLVVACPATVTGTLIGCNGSPVNGIVYLTSGSTGGYMATTNGTFSMPVPANTQVVVNAYTLNVSSLTTVTTSAAPGVSNVGNIILCDTSSAVSYENGFILDGNGFNHRVFVIDTSSTYGGYDPWILAGVITAYVQGHDSATNDNVDLSMFIEGTTLGIHNGYI